jgi:hypothetical protein
MTHGTPTTPSQAARTIAPCRRVIRPATAKGPGDGWSASMRFITCAKCLRIGKQGRFRLLYEIKEQLGLGLGGE